MRKIVFFSILTCLIFTEVGASLSEAANDWPTWRHDAQRKGYSPSEAVLSPPLQIAWTQFVGSGRNVIMESSPVIANGRVYMTTLGDFESGQPAAALYCFDLATGQELWSTLSLNILGTRSSPTVMEDKVYFVSEDGNLYCFHADAGTFLWQVPMAQYGTPSYASPAIKDGKLYIGTLGNFPDPPKLFILDAATGNILGQKALDPSFDIYGSPVLFNNLLFVGVGGYSLANGYLLCFDVTDPQNITELWRKPLQGQAMNTPAVSDNGFVYYIPFNYSFEIGHLSYIYCYRADASGAEERIYSIPEDTGWYMSPAIAYDNLYFGAGIKFYCIDLIKFHNQDPNPVRWSYSLPSIEYPSFIGSPAVANGFVYTSLDDLSLILDGAFYGFNAFTGEVVFYYAGSNNGVGSSQVAPAVGDGYVVFASYDDNDRTEQGIYCFKKKPSPRRGGKQVMAP